MASQDKNKQSSYRNSKQAFYNPRIKKSLAAGMVYHNLDYKDQKRLLSELGAMKSFCYAPGLVVKDYNSLFKTVALSVPTDTNGLGCLVNHICHYPDVITQFIPIREQIENKILLGEYDDCIALLDQLDSYCCSLWSFENRMLVTYLKNGIEETLKLKDEYCDGGMTGLCASFFWKKMEVRLSLSPISQYMDDILGVDMDTHKRFAFLHYKFLKYSHVNIDNTYWLALCTSIIDVYENAVYALTTHNDVSSSFSKQRISMLTDLLNIFDDKRLKKLSYIFTESSLSEESREHDDFILLYNKKKYSRIIKEAPQYINIHPQDLDVIILFVKSAIIQKEKCIDLGSINNRLLKKVVSNLFIYLSKGKDSSTAHSCLSVLANMFSSHTLGDKLAEVLSYYENPANTMNEYYLLDSYKKSLEKDLDDKNSLIAFENIDTPIFVKEKAAFNLFYSSLAEKNEVEAIRIYNKAYFENSLLVKKIQVESWVKGHDKRLMFLDFPPLDACIFYAISDSPAHLCYFFYKKFIKRQSSRKPSEFIDDYVDNMTPEMEYFFYKVCSTSILSMNVLNFRISEEVLAERLSILTKLTRITPGDKYLKEITYIKKRQGINSRVRELDQRMIYVDEQAIRENELEDVERLFRIYQNTEDSLETIELHVNNVRKQIKDDESNSKIAYTTFKVKYRAMLFKEMIHEIKKKFLNSPKNGLDFYISTRIRHGTLINQLRSSFEESDLVTNIKDGKYQMDELICGKLLKLDGMTKKEVQNELARFSKEIDDFIMFLKNEKIQVSATGLETFHSEAMFNYDDLINDRELQFIYLDRGIKINTFGEFVDLSFTFLWECTQYFLQKMVDYLDKVALEFSKKLYKMQANVVNIIGDNEKVLEFKILVSETQQKFFKDIDKIKTWFTICKSDEDDFTLANAIDACKESVSIHRNVQLRVKVNGDSRLVLRGEYFRKISDLIMIFFNNIVDYQQFIGHDIDVVIDLGELDNLVTLSIKNDVRTCDKMKISNMLSEIKTKWDTPQMQAQASKEKHSGLIKAYIFIHTLLPYDKEAFDVSLVDSKFTVKLKMDVTNWRAYEDIDS